MCGLYAVACEDFQFAKFPCVCGLCAVVCGDFEIFHKVTLSVGFVVWCVSTWSFQRSPVCMPCAVAFEDFEFSKFPCV